MVFINLCSKSKRHFVFVQVLQFSICLDNGNGQNMGELPLLQNEEDNTEFRGV